MHPSILYAQRGQRMVGDPYETGEFSREDGKRAFVVALNAKTRPGAISALQNKGDWPHSGKQTGKLLDLLARRNAPIADDLHADRGVTLMRVDSEITLNAVQGCIKAGIPALPVHDSMLTPERHEGPVVEIMEKSAAHVLKVSSPCRVRVSGHSVPHMPSPSLPSFLLPSSLSRLVGRSRPEQLDLFSVQPTPAFSNQIRALRDRLGLSQRALAEMVGCRQPHIANVERGRDRLGEWPRRRLRDLMREAACCTRLPCTAGGCASPRSRTFLRS